MRNHKTNSSILHILSIKISISWGWNWPKYAELGSIRHEKCILIIGHLVGFLQNQRKLLTFINYGSEKTKILNNDPKMASKSRPCCSKFRSKISWNSCHFTKIFCLRRGLVSALHWPKICFEQLWSQNRHQKWKLPYIYTYQK